MPILLILIFITALLANILAYQIKIILKNNGYSISYLTGYFKDTKNIFKLAKSTIDKEDRKKYFILAYANVGLTLLLIVIVIVALLILFHSKTTLLND